MSRTALVIGGGIVGYSTALQLKIADPHFDVVILERDLTYATAATGKGTGGIRQLFTRPENIALSKYTLGILDTWGQWASVDGAPGPDLKWQPNGYLFIARARDVEQLRSNYNTQVQAGVEAQWFEPDELGAKYPEIYTADLAGAVFSPNDGWLDPQAFFEGIQRKAFSLGARIDEVEVTRVLTQNNAVTGLGLSDGRTLEADVVVNAAGTRAPEIAATLDIDLPVEPMRRHEHYVVADDGLDHLPFIKDMPGWRFMHIGVESRLVWWISITLAARTSPLVRSTMLPWCNQRLSTVSPRPGDLSNTALGLDSMIKTVSMETPSSGTCLGISTTSTSPLDSPGTASCMLSEWGAHWLHTSQRETIKHLI